MKLGDICNGCGLKCTKDLATKDANGKLTGYADPCLGVLPGVKYACCGHGDPEATSYIFFENGVSIYFEDVVEIERTTYSKFHSFNPETKAKKVVK